MLPEPPRLPDKFDYPEVRAVLDDWFFRLTQSQMFAKPGMIVEYVGATPPDGWVECDGTEYDWDKFPDLAKVIGVESSPGKFEVPDATATPPTVGAIWIIKV